ncbi:MAG TPA: hypothetical protein DCE07_02895 [Peptococcaceae bacterium]|nr:hypothetical protein [Peptococcaceae bacterium]
MLPPEVLELPEDLAKLDAWLGLDLLFAQILCKAHKERFVCIWALGVHLQCNFCQVFRRLKETLLKNDKTPYFRGFWFFKELTRS